MGEIEILQRELITWRGYDAHIIFEYDIPRLGKRIDLVEKYEDILDELSKDDGLIGTIFTKATNKIDRPVTPDEYYVLLQLIVDPVEDYRNGKVLKKDGKKYKAVRKKVDVKFSAKEYHC